ncbi:hypothetical protein [Sorangium sp. So ce341]|uniref:hypothetical protein n=1 Tax=Sorangium sp. So ce341 TaxID=3133302 RepID=UPI003F61B135
MKLVAMLTEPSSIARNLAALGEPTDVPARSTAPTYSKSTALRREALGTASFTYAPGPSF